MSLCGNKLPSLGLVTLALLTLSACGTDLSPGTAATVNGTSISQNDVDDLVQAACQYVEISNKTSDQPAKQAISDLRSGITTALITFHLDDSAAEGLHLTILPANVAAAAGKAGLPDGLSDADAGLLTTFFYDSAKSQIQQATIGAHLKDDSVTTSASVTGADVKLSADYLNKYFADADITVNPAYGSWDGNTVTHSSGSLSDGVSDDATSRLLTPNSTPVDVSELPPTQVCG